MSSNNKGPDWKALAAKVDAQNRSGIEIGRKAIIELLGDAVLTSAVDSYVSFADGFSVAQSILDLLRPEVCRSRCLEIYSSDMSLSKREAAVDLLVTIGDASTLPWIETFLRDPNPNIQALGAAVLDRLVWAERVDIPNSERYIVLAEASENERVRETAIRIRRFLGERRQQG